jgi:hypothetical protein
MTDVQHPPAALAHGALDEASIAYESVIFGKHQASAP